MCRKWNSRPLPISTTVFSSSVDGNSILLVARAKNLGFLLFTPITLYIFTPLSLTSTFQSRVLGFIYYLSAQNPLMVSFVLRSKKPKALQKGLHDLVSIL